MKKVFNETKHSKLLSNLLYIALMIAMVCGHASFANSEGTYLDFNNFPATAPMDSRPADTATWEYSSSITNNYGYTESKGSGWKTKEKRADGYNWFFDLVRENSCSSHLGGGDTYGFLDITPNGHTDNALRYFVTGGRQFTNSSPCTGGILGSVIRNRESYSGAKDIYSGGNLGHLYLYFKKIDVLGSSQNFSPFQEIGTSNRLHFYVYLPSGTYNGPGGYSKGVEQTFQVGTFQNPTPPHSGHYYENIFTQGGGWTKVQIDETPNGNNSGDKRTYHIPNFLKTLYQFYLTTLPYSGEVPPPYEILIDDIGFERDTYTPQNEETISNIAVLFKNSNKTWEISWNDKYKITDAFSTWEVRYSLNGPITNENWDSATPVLIQQDDRFHIQARSDGKFQKWWPDTQGVWAPFRLSTIDSDNLTSGKTVYFAIKDISQTPGDMTKPTDGINGYWGALKGGRPYATNTNFDFNKDKGALPFIKRIAYKIPATKEGSHPPTALSAPKGLKLLN